MVGCQMKMLNTAPMKTDLIPEASRFGIDDEIFRSPALLVDRRHDLQLRLRSLASRSNEISS